MKSAFIIFCFICCSLLAGAQTRIVTGTVTNADRGEQLIGASVGIKGTTLGTTADVNGHYSLAIPDSGKVVLRINYVGYKEAEVTVGTQSEINVKLVNQGAMDEVVVIGYQTVRRRDLTGSVSSLSSKQIKDIPVNSAAEALTGRLAGVQLTSSEGSPNSDVTIRVRGGGSITQDNSPLYIIDGIEVENGLSAISPQDIETVDVLKDVSATAIYGARGSNGVVIITTKRGRSGKTRITYGGFVGVRKLQKKLDVMSPEQFVKYQYERSRGNATDSASFAKNYGTSWDTLSAYGNVPAVDWQDQLFGRSALFTTHNVSINGGNAATQFSVSLTSNKEEGIMQNSDYDRKLASVTLDHKVNKKLSVAFNTRYNNTVVHGAGTSNPGSSAVNNLRQTIRYRPFLAGGQGIDDYDADYAAETNSNSLNLVNPIVLNNAIYRKSNTSIFNVSGNVNYSFTDWLSFKTTLGYDRTNSRYDSFDDTVTYNSRLNGGKQPIASIGTATRGTLTNSNVFTYTNAKSEKAFAKKNLITALIGEETYENRVNSYYMEYHGFPVGLTANYALGNLGLGTPYTTSSSGVVSTGVSVPVSSQPSYENTEHIFSFFGRLNYTYNDKYLLTLSFRRDGSSKFAEGNQWGNFPSAAFAWRVGNESFMNKLKPILSDLKLRLSYGAAGNNRVPPYLYTTQFVSNTQYYLNNTPYSALIAGSLAYPDLTWESTISRNLGIDAGIFKNRITLTADIYHNSTKNLLVAVPVPAQSGYTTQIQNVGSTSNNGVEFQIAATPIQHKNINWTVTYNMSFNKNRVESLGDNQSFYLVNSGWAGSNNPADYIVQVGQPVGSMWGLVNDGYYKTDDFNYDPATKIYTLKTGVPNAQPITSALPAPGSIKFKDINGDGVINDKDRTVIGNAQPKFFGGLNQQFSYKNFDLSVFINFQYGNNVYNDNKLEFSNAYTTDANLLAIMNDRWKTIDANGNVVQQYTTVGGVAVVKGESPEVLNALNSGAKLWMPVTSNSAFYPNSWAVEDASFIRLNNITLGYTFPKSWLKRVKVDNFRIYFTANNLHVWTKYTGYDPEVSTRRSTPMTAGVDYSAYPRSRSYIFGVNLGF